MDFNFITEDISSELAQVAFLKENDNGILHFHKHAKTLSKSIQITERWVNRPNTDYVLIAQVYQSQTTAL